MTVWIFLGADDSAPGAEAVPPVGAGAVLAAGGQMDGGGEAGAVRACTGGGGADAAGCGKAAPTEANAAPCAELGTPA